ncbi:hypothetical protein EYV94_05120 [Puteibacter caeruleilacunae]|nr:hypothetical protein EYV94_05120 [Puteibacter caeruleilacunae]
MRNLVVVIVLVILGCGNAYCQSKRVIKEHKIKLVKSYEQDIVQGEKELLLEKEEYFDENGELIEEKKFDEKGRVKGWKKFAFNEAGKLVEEQELNYRGDVVKRIEYKYSNGLLVEKSYYDNKNRKYKLKRYEFQFAK